MKKVIYSCCVAIALIAIGTSCNNSSKSIKSDKDSTTVEVKTTAQDFEFGKEATIQGKLYEVPLSEPSETQMKTYVLALEKPINVLSKSADSETQNNVEEIQVDFSELVKDPAAFVDKKIMVKGKLRPSEGLHDKRPVVMDEAKIAK